MSTDPENTRPVYLVIKVDAERGRRLAGSRGTAVITSADTVAELGADDLRALNLWSEAEQAMGRG